MVQFPVFIVKMATMNKKLKAGNRGENYTKEKQKGKG